MQNDATVTVPLVARRWRLVTVVMVWQRIEGLSDGEAVERFLYGIRAAFKRSAVRAMPQWR